MAHGSVIVLDTSDNIKEKYGVGFHLIIENQAGLPIEILDNLVLNFGGFIKPATISSDSNDRRRTYFIPNANKLAIGDLIERVEESFPDVLIAVEVESLEDAYLKIVDQENSDAVPDPLDFET